MPKEQCENSNLGLFITEELKSKIINKQNYIQPQWASNLKNGKEVKFYFVNKELSTAPSQVNQNNCTSNQRLQNKLKEKVLPEVIIEDILPSERRKEAVPYRTAIFHDIPVIDQIKSNEVKNPIMSRDFMRSTEDLNNIESIESENQQDCQSNNHDEKDICDIAPQTKTTETTKKLISKTFKHSHDNPITSWKKGENKAIQSLGKKPPLYKSHINEFNDKFKTVAEDKKSSDKEAGSNEPYNRDAIRKYKMDKQVARNLISRKQKEEQKMREAFKTEKLKELDAKCKEIIKSSKKDCQLDCNSDTVCKATNIVITGTSNSHSTRIRDVPLKQARPISFQDFRVNTKTPSNDYFPEASNFLRQTSADPALITSNEIHNKNCTAIFDKREMETKDVRRQHKEIKEKHEIIKNFHVALPDYNSDSGSVKELFRKIVQKCDEQMLSATTSLESSVSKNKSKKLKEDFYQGDADDTASSMADLDTTSITKKERIKNMNINAQTLSETVKYDADLNMRLQNLLKNDSSFKQRNSSKPNLASTESSYTQYEQPSVEEIVRRITVLCPQAKAMEKSSFKPIDNTLELGFKPLTLKGDNKEKSEISRHSKKPIENLPFDIGSIEPLKLKVPPMSVFTLKSLHLNNTSSAIEFNKCNDALSHNYCNQLYTPIQLRSAIIIQSYFRGYKVRKITSCILKGKRRCLIRKSTNTPVPKLIKYNEPLSRVNPLDVYEGLKPTFLDDVAAGSSNLMKAYSSQESKETSKRLAASSNSTNLLRRSKLHSHQNKPEFRKHFVALTEAEDINSFVSRYPSNHDEVDQPLSRVPYEGLDLTLEEGPLNDISNISSLRRERETQTCDMDLKTFRKKPCVDTVNFTLSEGPLSDFSQTILTDKSVQTSFRLKQSKRNIAPKLLKMPSNFSSLKSNEISMETGSSLRKFANHSSSQDSYDTMPSESTVSNDISSYSLASETEFDNHPAGNVSKLGSRICAELIYQDTLGNALDHLQELQNLRVISQAEVEASKLTSTLKEFQLKNSELLNGIEQEKKQNSVYEEEVKNYREKIKEKEMKQNMRHLKKEAHERISKLEEEYKLKAEAAISHISNMPVRNDPEIIAAATAAAVSASIHALGNATNVKYKFNKYNIEESSESPKSSNNSIIASYSDDFSQNSAEQSSKSDKSSNYTSKECFAEEPSISVPTEVSKIAIQTLKSDIENSKISSEYTDAVDQSLCSTESVPKIINENDLCSSSRHSMINNGSNLKDNLSSDITEVISTTSISHALGSFHEINTELELPKNDSEIYSNKLLVNSKLSNKTPADNTSASYSASFETDSRNSDASESSSSILQIVKKASTSDVEKSHNQFNINNQNRGAQSPDPPTIIYSQCGTPTKSNKGALHSTLTLLESLQKEEEIRFNYQKALLKMQEQKLIFEARQKLDLIQLEGGINVRKKQRAILLTLREQKSHIKRFIETQMLAAQQRQLIFLQHKDLLSSTTNMANLTNLQLSRGPSPSISHMLDLNLSSSEGPDNSSILSFRNIAKSSSDMSEEECLIASKQEDKRNKTIREDSKKSNSPILKERDKSIKRDDKGWRRKDLFTKPLSLHKYKASNKNEPHVYNNSTIESNTKDDEDKISINSELSKEMESFKVNIHDGQIIVAEPVPKEYNVALNNSTMDKVIENLSTPLSSNETNIESSASKIIDSTIQSGIYLNDKAGSDSEIITSTRYSITNLDCVGRVVPFSFKIPLSPRAQLKQNRRQSSESDDSFTLSQNETTSDHSDGGEGRLVALREELALRKGEAEKLQKEKRKMRRERLASQEQALKKQILAYESYIKGAKLEIERESQELQHIVAVKPLIKKPHVTGSVLNKKLRIAEDLGPEKSIVYEESLSVDVSLIDRSENSNKSCSAADLDISHISSGSSSKKSYNTEDSYSSNSFVESENDSQLYKSDSEKDVVREMLIINEETKIPEKLFDIKENKIESCHALVPMANIDFKPLEGTLNKQSKLDDSESKEELEVPVDPKSTILKLGGVKKIEFEGTQSSTESSISQDSEQSSVSLESSTDTIYQSPKKSNSLPTPSIEKEVDGSSRKSNSSLTSLEIENNGVTEVNPVPIESSKGDNTVSTVIKSDKLETSDIPIISDTSLLKDNKLDIFIPSHKTMLHSKETEDETITEDIIEELPADVESFSDDEPEKSFNKIKITPISVDIEGQKFNDIENVELGKRADKVASSILQNILESSVKHMINILSDREKEVGVISMQIQEFGEVELKSENAQIPLNNYNSKCNESPISPTKNVPVSNVELSLVTEDKDFLNLKLDATPIIPNITPDSLSPDNVSPNIGLASGKKYIDEIGSPLQSPAETKNLAFDPNELTSRLLSIQDSLNSPDLTLEDPSNRREEFSVSSSDGNWPDNEWWISGDKFNAQLELKEEEEKLNAEIALLEELQLFKKMHPHLVIREVPNKPPPPYAPPRLEEAESPINSHLNTSITPAITPLPVGVKVVSKELRPTGSIVFPQPQSPSNTISVPHRLSKADLRKLAAELFNVVPTKEEDILPVIQSFVDLLYKEWQNGVNPLTVENPAKKEENVNSQNNEKGDKEVEVDSLEVSSQAFQHLLFDLTKELVSEIYVLHKAPPPPPWMNSSLPHPAKPWLVGRRLNKENLLSYVMGKVRVLMGWESRTKRESTMVKWARKKRDLVDQILVHELQSEELSWTKYDEEEVEVKNELSRDIMDTIIEDTVKLFQKIVENKIKYINEM